MACFEYGTIVELGAQETVTLPDARSATLRVTRGTVWITQEGDPQDVVLRAGDSWVVERNGLTVVEAQGDVAFCIVGRRIESLLARRRHSARSPSVWAQTHDAVLSLLAAFVTSPRRGPAPYV
jgi:hypothetical protein